MISSRRTFISRYPLTSVTLILMYICLPLGAADSDAKRSFALRGKENALTVYVKPNKVRTPIDIDVKTENGKFNKRFSMRPFRNQMHIAEFNGLNVQWHFQPHQLRNPKFSSICPPYNLKTFRFDFVSTEKHVEIWIDGRFAHRIKETNKLKGVDFSRCAGVTFSRPNLDRHSPSEPFIPLDLSYQFSESPLFATSEHAPRISIKPGLRLVNGIPMNVLDASRGLDLGRRKRDGNNKRSPFEGSRDLIHYSVPQRVYARAHVLCANIDKFNSLPRSSKEMSEPILGVRLCRFGRWGVGEAISNTHVNIQKDKERVKRVGTFTYWDGKTKKSTPLYLATLELRSGEILDLCQKDEQDGYAAARLGPYLDLEFLGRCNEGSKHLNWYPSSVQVFACTLTRPPWNVMVEHTEYGCVFHNDDKPEIQLDLWPLKSGSSARAVCHVYDRKGTEIGSHSRTIRMGRRMAKVSTKLPFPNVIKTGVGYYDFMIELFDEKGTRQFHHKGSLAWLGRDTREAGYESPYGVWAFGGGVHHCEERFQAIGSLCLRAGFRRISNGPQKTVMIRDRNGREQRRRVPATEKDLAPYKLTLNQIPQFRKGIHDKQFATVDVYRKRYKEHVLKYLKDYPSCQYALVFHEIGGLGIPSYLLGYDPKKPNPNEMGERSRNWKTSAATVQCQVLRKEFPKVKSMVINSCAGAEMIAWMYESGFDFRLADCMGIETPGYSGYPERPNWLRPSAAWMTNETFKKLGLRVPLNGCFEYTYRTARWYDQDEYSSHYMRDILMGLGFGFRAATPALLEDCGADYWHSKWGGSGYCHREPFLYPRRAYVAAATLTKALDSAYLLRRFDTGAASVYALEFERRRRNADFAYAFWTPQHTYLLRMTFPAGTSCRLVQMYGGSRVLKLDGQNQVTFRVGSQPCYLISSQRASEPASIAGYVRKNWPGTMRVINEFNKLNILGTSRRNYGLINDWGYPTQMPGDFEVRIAKDPEFGNVMEFKLVDQRAYPAFNRSYTTVQLKSPIVVNRCDGVGFWIRGNSSWGNVLINFVDAEGKYYRSPDADSSCLNFESWQFMPVSFGDGLKCARASRRSDGRSSSIQFPIRITGISVITSRYAHDPHRLVPIDPTIQFCKLSVIDGVPKKE